VLAARNTETSADDRRKQTVQEVHDFLKKCGAYYVATVEGDQPRVRAFGTVNVFDERLYIQTGKVKAVSKQMKANPKIEICAFNGNEWIRVQATVVDDPRVEAKQSMLDAYPQLLDRYSATDDNTQVLYLKDAVATISSFSGPPRVIEF
jgi:uncharacterized pyridoxamine 5'-phosphate oxidase family protein